MLAPAASGRTRGATCPCSWSRRGAEDDVAARALRAGAADFMAKPFRVRELLARIQSQLRVARHAAPRATPRCATASEALVESREEAKSRRELVDILHEVTGELSAEEIYRILARRVARALDISHCSVVLARAGRRDAASSPRRSRIRRLRNLEIRLDRYPEIRAALDHGAPVLVEDGASDPLFGEIRKVWAAEGADGADSSVDRAAVHARPVALGVLLPAHRAASEPPLTHDDVEFADTVIRAAVAAIQRAQALETTRADNARLEALATTDPLTRVLNRRALLDRLDARDRPGAAIRLVAHAADARRRSLQAHQRHARPSRRRRGAAAARARCSKSAVRKVDIVARYGGEEFVVILPETRARAGSCSPSGCASAIAAQVVRECAASAPLRLTVEHRRRHFSVAARRVDRRFLRAGRRGAVSREVRGRNQVRPDESLPDCGNA